MTAYSKETEHLNDTFLNLSKHILSKQKEYARNLLKYQNHVRDQCLLSRVVPSENVSNYLTDITRKASFHIKAD